MKATVLGASGFIGRNLVRRLENRGYEVATPDRAALGALSGSLGHVFYCIGLTGNFRERPFATVEAHAGLLAGLLQRTEFDSFLYFSSTRIYARATGLEETGEEAPIRVTPSADTTYDLSKMLGEALCLSHDLATVRVARLSNVYGPDQSPATFLGSLIQELTIHGQVEIREAPGSSKDYISIRDVTDLGERIARSGRERIYNLASGQPVSHAEIAATATGAGFTCGFAPGGAVRAFPRIDTTKLQTEFDFHPRLLLEDLPSLLSTAAGSAA
jgi:nucleoside-diphosphate-sugar epimerase